jgi:Universal stress protein family
MRIVCSVDESTAARDAAEIAGQVAHRMRAELVYVHSVTGESSERLGASHRRCDLLIVGYTPRARFASALLGEAHRRLVRDAACPVMLVPAGARLRAGTGIVLGYNLPSISSAAAVAAGRLAGALGSLLVVAHVEAAGAPGRATGGQLNDGGRRLTEEAVGRRR